MKILDSKQIQQKINRIAIQILERNFAEKEIVLAGINNNGMGFAKLLLNKLRSRTDIDIKLCQIRLNPAKPTAEDVSLDMDEKQLTNKVIIIVDDVANTGRTIFYAFKPFLNILPKKIEVVVLVDRKHKSFPVKPDYVGLALATTTKENIAVTIKPIRQAEVQLV